MRRALLHEAGQVLSESHDETRLVAVATDHAIRIVACKQARVVLLSETGAAQAGSPRHAFSN